MQLPVPIVHRSIRSSMGAKNILFMSSSHRINPATRNEAAVLVSMFQSGKYAAAMKSVFVSK